MKLINLIWVLALAGAVAGCNSGTAITGELPGTGGPGPGGGGGTCDPGGGDGACTNDADQAVYENLTYTDEVGDTFTGKEAASAIGSDCIFGTTTSDPVLSGCGLEATQVLSCFAAGCPQETIDALAACVAQCTQDATGLSTECMACTGDTVACGAANCTTDCSADTNAPACTACRCAAGCFDEFDACSGLPSDCNCE